jgi:RNA:NAD 2'-phosphotransferase (TPT1/KptA family)
VELTDNSGSEVEQEIEIEEVVSPVPPPPVRSRTEDAKVRAKLSPLLAKTLRHMASSWGLKLEADGYALVTSVLALQPFEEQGFTTRDIEHVVHWERQENRKQRFSLRYGNHGLEIRANQGHSDIGINSQLLAPIINPLELPTHLLHGTYFQHVEQILQDGLRPMGRHHIHLFLEEGGIGRRDAEVLVHVDVAKALASGVSFMQAENNVILSAGGPEGTIPSCCLKIVRVCNGEVLNEAAAALVAPRPRYVPPHRRADWSSMQEAAMARLVEAEEHATLPAIEAVGSPKRRSGCRTARRRTARASAV